jgi:hypothetical protein
MLTGKPPYAGMHSFAAMYKIVEDDEPPIPKNLNLSEVNRWTLYVISFANRSAPV